MQYSLSKIDIDTVEDALGIINQYVDSCTAAFREDHLGKEHYQYFLKSTEKYPSYVVLDEKGKVIGICRLKPFLEMSTFDETAELMYFLNKEYTGKGIGSMLLAELEKEAYARGIRRLIVSISEENHGSQKFHEKHGFVQCGVFHDVGKKFGRYFSIVWMEKEIKTPEVGEA
ncbi:MAG: N-acetyltransferase family protein [Sphaerochaetaceae bacterium]|jgi:phosphinothricin acetyltransferase